MHSKKYIDYLKSDLWQQRRLAALERANFRCQLCGEVDSLEVHHKTYDRLGNELPSDLIVICKAHHWEEDEKRRGVVFTEKEHAGPCSIGKNLQDEINQINSKSMFLNSRNRSRMRYLTNELRNHKQECDRCRNG